MSRVYHYIRGQSVMKLYVIYNMAQVCDRLLASFGEDILDSLFANVWLGYIKTACHFVLASIYVCMYHPSHVPVSTSQPQHQ